MTTNTNKILPLAVVICVLPAIALLLTVATRSSGPSAVAQADADANRATVALDKASRCLHAARAMNREANTGTPIPHTTAVRLWHSIRGAGCDETLRLEVQGAVYAGP
jgi:hypothetical protein